MNDDLISRSALLKDIEELVVFTVKEGQTSAEIRGANKIVARIEAAPTVDAETIFLHLDLMKEAFAMAKSNLTEVVRCDDCAVPHNRWTGCPNLNGMIPPEDFYCARGERRKDNGA